MAKPSASPHEKNGFWFGIFKILIRLTEFSGARLQKKTNELIKSIHVVLRLIVTFCWCPFSPIGDLVSPCTILMLIIEFTTIAVKNNVI